MTNELVKNKSVMHVRETLDPEEVWIPDNNPAFVAIGAGVSAMTAAYIGLETDSFLNFAMSFLGIVSSGAAISYPLRAFRNIHEILSAQNIPCTNISLSSLFQKRTFVHEYMVSNLSFVSGKPQFAGNRYPYNVPSKTDWYCNTSVVWTKKGLVIDQTFTPTAGNMWDKSLENASKIYARKGI